MSVYKSFAVVGAGRLGSGLLSALAAKENISVILLSRPGSTKTAPSNVQVVPVDYTDVTAVSAGLGTQKSLADAAKLAAVKLFVPSEFGSPSHGNPNPFFKAKNDAAAYLKSVGIPSTRIYVDWIFMEYIPMIGSYDKVNGKFTIIGNGDLPISTTSLPDIAGFVAHALTSLPPAQLEDRILRLEGDRASWKDIAKLFNASIERVTSFSGDPMAGTGWDAANKREGSGDEAAGSANALWPGHKWQSIKEVHGL
ncbi:hypothetical protein K438DRAFT_1979426 [Mycena galopus ATCC 62051]|nr:hypothetical protein K438DRAFT_1979426 [Mycena galopus ATCC 62051]